MQVSSGVILNKSKRKADRGGAWPRPRVTLRPRKEAPRPEPGLPDIAVSSLCTAPAGSVARGSSQSTSHHRPDSIAANATEVAQSTTGGKAEEGDGRGGASRGPALPRSAAQLPQWPPGGDHLPSCFLLPRLRAELAGSLNQGFQSTSVGHLGRQALHMQTLRNWISKPRLSKSLACLFLCSSLFFLPFVLLCIS